MASRNLQTTATALVEGTILATPSENLPELLEPLYKVPSTGRMAVLVPPQSFRLSGEVLVQYWASSS